MAGYTPTSKELAREHRVLNDPVWWAEREHVRGLLHQLREAGSAHELLLAQASLVARVKARQEFLAKLKSEVALANACRREAVDAVPRDERAVKEAQAALEAVHGSRTVHERLHELLLSVGDVMLWRALGANRAAIAALGQGTPVGWLSSGSGWEAELRAVDQLWRDEGVAALINDVTTCVRLGDLTCLFPDRIDIREVKASATPSPESAQMKRLTSAVDLINDGTGEFDGHHRAIVRSEEPYKTHIEALPDVLDGARRHGRHLVVVSDHHVVVGHDLTHASARSFPPPDGAEAKAAARWRDDDLVLTFGTSLRRMRDRKGSHPFLAPVGLLPLRLDDVTDLLIGAVDYTTYVNVSRVARYLAGRGWIASPPPLDQKGDRFMEVTRDRHRRTRREITTISVAPHVREMMLVELATAPAIADMVSAMFAAVDADADLLAAQPMVVPGSEHGVWALSA